MIDTKYNAIEKTLAIFPNGKGFGYALFVEPYEPKQYGVATIKPTENYRCMRRIDALVETYQPTVILLPTPDGKRNRKRKRVQELLHDISQYAESRNIKILCYSREQIRLVFEQFEARSKLEIAEKICLWMEELERYQPLHRKRYMPEDYYQCMFDAISLFITHMHLMD